MRVCQGVYVRPIQTRFGPSPACTSRKCLPPCPRSGGRRLYLVEGWRRTPLDSPRRCRYGQVYLTSGPDRKLKLGGLAVELRHAPRWQLVAPHRPAGDAVRALAWLGPEEVEENLGAIEKRLSSRDLEELAATRAVIPAWLAEPVSTMVADS